MKLSQFYFNASRWVAAASLAALLAGCDDSFVFEDLDECVPDYRVSLSFTRHLDGDKEKRDLVSHGLLYLFDEQGNYVQAYSVDKNQLAADQYTIKVPDAEKDKKYRFIFWGGVGDNPQFQLTHQLAEASKADGGASFTYADLKCHIAMENGVSNSDLGNMFHSTGENTFTKMTGLDTYQLDLTKDTNDFTISIENELDEKFFEIWIEDTNDVLDHTNNIHSKETTVKYYPVTKINSTKLLVPDGNGGYTEKTAQGTVATFSTSRLVKDSGAKVKIFNKNVNKMVLEEPLDNFINKDNRYDDQEYRDRCDKYYMYVDVEDWSRLVIKVNEWVTVINNIEFTDEKK